jgi:hypothetical protein
MAIRETFNKFDTTRADGVYVRFERLEHYDEDASPMEYLYQDEEYKAQDDARLAAFHAGDWHFIGIAARALVEVIRSGVGTMYTLTSAGLWAIESDSSEEYLSEVYGEECDSLLSDLRAMHEVQEIFR